MGWSYGVKLGGVNGPKEVHVYFQGRTLVIDQPAEVAKVWASLVKHSSGYWQQLVLQSVWLSKGGA